jgi:hypothetical protein
VDAARAFEKESGTEPGVDLEAIKDRMEIRRAVQSGSVEVGGEGVAGTPVVARFVVLSCSLPAGPHSWALH